VAFLLIPKGILKCGCKGNAVLEKIKHCVKIPETAIVRLKTFSKRAAHFREHAHFSRFL
jgi:hypothetical protein